MEFGLPSFFLPQQKCPCVVTVEVNIASSITWQSSWNEENTNGQISSKQYQ